MQTFSLGLTVLADLPGVSGAAYYPHINGGFIAYNLVGIAVGILAMWLAAKVVVPQGNATFANVMKVWLLNICLIIGMIVGLFVLGALVVAMHDQVRSLVVGIGYLILVLCLIVAIPMKVYEIAALRAIGLILLTFVIQIAMMVAGLLATTAAYGQERVMAFTGQKQLIAQMQSRMAQIQQAQPGQPAPAFFNPFSSSPPPPPDNAAEIDALLNAALHPAGPKPSLEERENMVRSLQQKLQAQKASLPSGDAHALAAYQNRLNRYLLFLNAVKAERQLQAARNAAARQAASASVPRSP